MQPLMLQKVCSSSDVNDCLLLTSFYALNAKVVELKEDQDRGPKTQKNKVKTSKPEIGAMLDL